MEFNLDTRKVPEGTVLLFAIRYPGSNEGRVYTYTMIKAGGMWYVSGTGRAPQAAGWGAVKNWLAKDGRQVVSVKVATQWRELWPKPDDLGAHAADGAGADCGRTPDSAVHHVADERHRGTEWREQTRTPEDDALGYHGLD